LIKSTHAAVKVPKSFDVQVQQGYADSDMCRIFKYSSQDSSRLDVAAMFIFQSSRYAVPAGKVIIIVSPGRLSLVPTGRVLSPGRVK
ncbi:hypothetical protein Tco_0704546, partial [Tanacetum coccineum]